MENAGKNSCEFFINSILISPETEIFIFCGKGNNAGDGFTFARHLLINNLNPTIVLFVTPDSLKGDALINYNILKKIGGDFMEYDEFVRLAGRKTNKHFRIYLIDAVLGTGINGKLDEKYTDDINYINKFKENNPHSIIIALDVPSGLMSGEQVNPVVTADFTISMGTYKKELLFGDGKENCGEMKVVPIGISDKKIDSYNSFGKYIVEFEDIQKLFPKRKKVSHKYTNGKVLIIGGSKGLSGAIAMSSLSALKSGAGAVVAAIPDCISKIFNRKLFEAMTIELDETAEGTIKNDQLDKIKKRIDWADIVLIGPGISTNDSTREFVIDLVSKCEKPMVIDADGLNNLSTDLSVLKSRISKPEIFLTPHIGEFSKLTNADIKKIQINRFELVKNFAEEYKVNISLKSETTLSYINSSSKTNDEFKEKFYINSSGNELLASAGSGDILSGIITSMYAQTKDAYKTLVLGNYLHGYCADLYAEEYGNKQSAAPQDIIKLIPQAITKILN